MHTHFYKDDNQPYNLSNQKFTAMNKKITKTILKALPLGMVGALVALTAIMPINVISVSLVWVLMLMAIYSVGVAFF